MCIRDRRDTLLSMGVHTYKTSVYHPSSNPAERVLREVGRLLRTYCHDQQRRWQEYLEATEEFLNLAYHPAIGITPYSAMYERQPPREIADILEFPREHKYRFDKVQFCNKVAEDQEKRRKKYNKGMDKVIHYTVGEKVLLKNRELPSSLEGITKKLLLLYTGPYIVSKDNNNNTYEIKEISSSKVKGVFNQASMKKF